MKPGAKSFNLFSFLCLALVFYDWVCSLWEYGKVYADHLLEADSLSYWFLTDDFISLSHCCQF